MLDWAPQRHSFFFFFDPTLNQLAYCHEDILKLFTLVALGSDKNQSRAVYPDGAKKQDIQHKSKWAIRWTSRKAFENNCQKSITRADDSVRGEEEKAQMNTSLADCLKLFVSHEKLGKNDEW